MSVSRPRLKMDLSSPTVWRSDGKNDPKATEMSSLACKTLALSQGATFEDRENYVARKLKNTKPRPPITSWWGLSGEVYWFQLILLTMVPTVGLIGAYYTPLRWETGLFAVLYYFYTGLGITAGYHRLWSHRCYNASNPLKYFLALGGVGAVQGSIKWWSRGHRAHHRFTDTKLDPYNAKDGFWYSHIGWLIIKPRIRPGTADVSDLARDHVVRWQHKFYFPLLFTMGFVVPTIIPWLFWDDLRGGYIYAALLRLTFVHHSTFCVNSLAHWLGEARFDDKNTPRDHVITALVTIGEGYHNFHHQFPMDYRNAIKWYQYDPTKWFIWICQQLRLASHLKTFSDNEVRKGELTMQLKRLRQQQDHIVWPQDSNDLPVVSWESYQKQSAERPLILISGLIHDVSTFIDEHPGGAPIVARYIGKDATTAFFGGVYEHSSAAHNLLAMKRVGILHGGMPHGADDRIIPPSQRLWVARYTELGSSSACSESEPSSTE
ncbi:Delta-9 fatty acid desaturase protein [Mycena chlorophos]|uniref:Acyl-CoA desaturase n=1 Tax=Mycena chlorophos TaxID=658473 RepID=A0A8H6TQ71_MYCCL|nr:Delta-9 fatty acid desaturase protein [Mycena chlorophos]